MALDLLKMCPKFELQQTNKFVYLHSTYVISVQFVGSKHDLRDPKKLGN